MTFEEFKAHYQKLSVKESENIVSHNPLVSVCVATYQHSNYIRKCLDSILMQKTDFIFEILLGEDASTDGTRDICIEYAEKNINKIRLFLHHRENNISIEGCPTGRFNFIYNLYNTKGKYIAICEGDDYWTDPLKLQKQVDFLEDHPDYSVCFHPVKILRREKLINDIITRQVKETTNIYDLAKGNYLHTVSVIFRKKSEELPKWLLVCPIGDYPLHMINAENGKIKKLKDTMAVYRIHDSNMWANQKEDLRLQKTIQCIDVLASKFDDQANNNLNNQKKKLLRLLDKKDKLFLTINWLKKIIWRRYIWLTGGHHN